MKEKKKMNIRKEGEKKEKKKYFVYLSTFFWARIVSGKLGYFLIDDICKRAV